MRRTALVSLLALAACAPLPASNTGAPTPPAPIDAHEVKAHVDTLAADGMEGRGIGTKGIDQAANYIAMQLAMAGVKPGVGKSYFEPFEMTVGVTLGSSQSLTIGGTPMKLDQDWRPLQFSESGTVQAPVVFAGYGITAPELHWDDYEGVDVTGKIVLVLRHEPGEKDPHSAFDGEDLTRYSELRVKAINARVHGATALILVNDVLAHSGEADELIKLDPEADAVFSGLPAIQIRREVAKTLLGEDVADAEKKVTDKPASRLLPKTDVRVAVSLVKTHKPVKNVVGVLPGADPALAKEWVVIGAHYDHLGFGGRDSLDPDKTGQVHNGADDNASGDAALLGIARAIAAGPKPKRSVMFVFFTGEEAGLVGSSWYVNHPLVPLESTIAMLNMDMVGRMRDSKVIAFGADTATEFKDLLEQSNTEKLEISAHGDGYGPSDQTAFYSKNVPVLHFFTGAHADYHRTTDDSDKINADGLASVARLVQRVALGIANRDARVTFVPSSSIAHAQGSTGSAGGGYGAYFGSIPDFTESDVPGVAITGVRSGSPAEKAGLMGGDRIVKFGDVTIGNLYDLAFALKKYKPGDEVQVEFVRGSATKSVKATLRTHD
jgi:hypothetical protein